MKRIGIITIDKCNNFGAELQACATVRILREMGYDAELIDYLYFKNPGHKPTKLSTSIAPQTISKKIFNIVKYRFATKILYNIIPIFSSTLKIRNECFNKFHDQNTQMSITYRSMDELYYNVKKYDVYIVGSDQVWNPFTESSLAPYFLQFAPNGARKISYASSFGVSEIPEFAKTKYKEWLNDFYALSCRENIGVSIINQLIGRKALQVLDPTLLLNKEQWLEIKGNTLSIKEEYVLIYEAYPSSLLQRMACEYASSHGMKVYRLCLQGIGNKKTLGIINIESAGPAEYVHVFANASYILTNSFHGTAFACNFGKIFNTVLSKNNKKISRMTSLLEMLNLVDRIVWEEEKFPSVYGQPYDYERTQLLLERERNKSIQYLISSIES